MSFTVCAFYTDDELYRSHAEEFKLSLAEVGIGDFHIKKIPPIERWVEACAIKPQFILDTLRACEDNVLYVDIDARFRSFPTLFNDFPHDLGAHMRDGHELLSGTLFFRNCDNVKKLVRLWLKNQRRNPDSWDQHVLQNTINENPELNLNLANLPPAYCQIFDSMAHHGTAVIEHLQASRQHPDKQPMPLIELNHENIQQIAKGETVVLSNLNGIQGGKLAIQLTS